MSGCVLNLDEKVTKRTKPDISSKGNYYSSHLMANINSKYIHAYNTVIKWNRLCIYIPVYAPCEKGGADRCAL